MLNSILKIAEQMDQLSNHKDADLIADYALKLSKNTKLIDLNLKTDLFTKLLMLEKVGVDTSAYYNKILDASLKDKDVDEINQKFEVNCHQKINKKDTDFHEYVLKVTKKKPKKDQNSTDPKMDKYLDELRETFTQFLSDIVKKDYKKEFPNKSAKPSEIINYYFENRDKYENQLDSYDLMMGQTEGILTDKTFQEEINEELLDEIGNMIRQAPHT